MRISRRELLLQSARLAPAAGVLGKASGLLAFPEEAAPQGRKLRIVVTGGHPGDPECGCGGTVARYTDAGHEAMLLYLNRGEGYCGQSDLKDCSKIRTAEAEKACAILKARPVFAGQYDGRAVLDPPHYDAFSRLLLEQEPNVVFTHWPMDAHRDHRAMAGLVLDAWLNSKKKFALYYYEVAEDTLLFPPPISLIPPAWLRVTTRRAMSMLRNSRTNGFRYRWRLRAITDCKTDVRKRKPFFAFRREEETFCRESAFAA